MPAGALGVGYICLRLRGPYFALGTLAMGEVLRVTAENLETFTGGARGIMLDRRTWVGKEPYYYIILGMTVVTFARGRVGGQVEARVLLRGDS